MNDSELIQRLRRLETPVEPAPTFADGLFATLREQAQGRRRGLSRPQVLLAVAAFAGLALVATVIAFSLLAGRAQEPGPQPTVIVAPSPSASPSSTPDLSPSPSPTTPPTAPPDAWLAPGTIYDSLNFTEPFHFLMTAMDPSLAGEDGYTALESQWDSAGVLRISMGCCWNTYFLDDTPVNVDACDPTKGTLADLPATPAEVGEWLRSSSLLTVSDPVEVPVDGRTALRFDTDASGSCLAFVPSAPSVFVGQRFYAIPTGNDTIVYVVWGDEGSYPFIKQGADDLVRSMTFD